MFLECLNYNYKSLICLVIEYFISKNIIDINKDIKNIILIFIFNFVNYIQNNFKENGTVKEYTFNFKKKSSKEKISTDKLNNIKQI